MEYTINGKIIAKNGAGLKNLLVLFYDTDRKLTIPKNLKKNILEFLEEKGSERLGSTYSKSDGSFEFNYDYKDFAPQKEEKRPDIIVVVLAPEEKERELKDRVLYVSDYPLLNGGQNEALIINVSSPDISNISSGSKNIETKVATILKSIEVDEKEEQLLKTHLTPKIAKKFEKQKKRKKETDTLFKNISTIPKALRDSHLFMGKEDSFIDVSETIIIKGLERLDFKNSSLLPVILTDKDKKELGIDDSTNPINEINIPYSRYCGLLNKKTKGKTLVRKDKLKDILDEIINKKNTDSEKPSKPDSCKQFNSSNGIELIKEGEETKFINDKISEVYGPIQNTLDNSVLHANIKTRVDFDQDTSAANQKAFHDFHNLQIAFEDVWSELLDEKISENITSTYNQIVDVLEEYNGEGKFNVELRNSYNELEQLLNGEKNNLTRIVAFLNEKSALIGEGIPMPSKLQKLNLKDGILDSSNPDKLKENWRLLSINQQNQIISVLNTTELDRYIELSYEEKVDVLFTKTQENYVEIISKQNDTWKSSEGNHEHNGDTISKVYNDNDINGQKGSFIDKVLKQKGYFDTNSLSYLNEKFNYDNSDNAKAYAVLKFSLKPYFSSFDVDKNAIKSILNNPKGIKTRVSKLIDDINKRLLEPYKFHVFAKNSVNYGIMTTYRQEWTPSNWQVGDLVSTIPLAPGEKRKFTKKLKVKRTRSQKEVESSLSKQTDEASYITKAHSEIFSKASTATNFNLTVEGSIGFEVGVAKGGVKTTTGYKNDQSSESSAKKKGIRESTRKAANEFKNERSVEIISKEESDYEESTSGEILNPNNEITVTYLFYELERQFIVSENLHKLTPIIMVAFDVPAPHEIDEDWLLTHEWILRRILLDDSFHEALDYLREGFIGDEINYEAAKGHYHQQKEMVNEISANVSSLMSLRSRLQSKLNTATNNENIVDFEQRKRDSTKTNAFLGALINPFQAAQSFSEFNNAGSELEGQYDSEFYEAERKALDSRINQVREELGVTGEELASESNTLEKAKNQMMAITTKIYTKRNLINQLRIHVKQNILYYMQGIWEHEPPDQRFFRLYDKVAPMPKPKDVTITQNDRNNSADYFRNIGYPISDLHWLVGYPKPNDVDFSRRLHEVADIDNLLGFKGNYAIFPLKECTYITDFMMKDYVNEYLGIQDPDFDNEISTEDLKEIQVQIKGIPEHKELAERVSEILTARLANPVIKDETIVVPTGQLYIEALPGKHALLEDFKLKHRAMDVLKVQEEVREAQIENLRKSARVLNKDYEDGDIEKIIKVSGAKNINVNE